MKKKTTTRRRRVQPPRDPNHYPKGWDQKRVDAVARYYENQTDEEAIAELEAALDETVLMPVPIKLVPAVQKLLSKRAG
jgi:hypothetical protein